jgi:DDE superfamily endonuclease
VRIQEDPSEIVPCNCKEASEGNLALQSWLKTMSTAPSHSTDASQDLELLVTQAAGIVAGSLNTIGISRAMELVGLSFPDATQKMKYYQQVRRKSAKLTVVEKGKSTPVVLGVEEQESVSTLTVSTEIAGSQNNSETSPSDSIRRRLRLEETEVAETVLPSTDSVAVPAKKKQTRRSPKELQRMNAKKCAEIARNKEAMKAATTRINSAKELDKNNPKRLSINAIVNETNKQFNSTLNSKTVGRYVREGMIGTSPLKTGPVGDFPKTVYSALKGSFVTFLKLEQSESKKQSTVRQLSVLVNACVNRAGFSKVGDGLTRKLQRDTADQFEVGKAIVIEQRRVQWTTQYNLDVWFSTFKELLIELGFGRERQRTEPGEGEIVFFENQKERIINFDETDGSIDDTNGQRGGRPPVVFFATDVSGGATAVNKSGYSSTIICGSNAAGEPIPPHFQLKSVAEDKNMRLSIEWFTGTKDVKVKFGHRHLKAFPCTFGANEKAGMTSTELDKYLHSAILPLFPDIADRPGKRVIIKLDSGPGRTNLEMLAKLRLQGCYIVPGVPNTTGKTQETDQNYGPFKSAYRSNIRTLTQARFDNNLQIGVHDLPLLVFGGTCTRTGVQLVDAFTQAFATHKNLSAWRKCGAVPLTRKPLHANEVRREVPVGRAASILGDDALPDPQVSHLIRLEEMNCFYCSVLDSHGYDGQKLSKKAPKRSTYVAVTAPVSLERVKAIKEAHTHGQLFYATGGRHTNSNEFFKARELKRREPEIKKMEDLKAARIKYCQEQMKAVKLIREKGELTWEREKVFRNPEIEMLLKWKKVVIKSKRKKDMIQAYVDAPKPKIQKTWCRSEEAALVNLRNEVVALKDTAVGVATTQMARAVTDNMAQLDTPTRNLLKQSLQEYEDEKGDCVI